MPWMASQRPSWGQGALEPKSRGSGAADVQVASRFVGAENNFHVGSGQRLPETEHPVDPGGPPVVGDERFPDVPVPLLEFGEVGDTELDVESRVEERILSFPLEREFLRDRGPR